MNVNLNEFRSAEGPDKLEKFATCVQEGFKTKEMLLLVDEDGVVAYLLSPAFVRQTIGEVVARKVIEQS